MEGRSSTIPTASKKMIIVTLNEDRYAYDIHSLVKAFYPEQEIKVFVKEPKKNEVTPGCRRFSWNLMRRPSAQELKMEGLKQSI